MRYLFFLFYFVCSVSYSGEFTPVLMYHRITNDFLPGSTVVQVDNFKKHIQAIKQAGYKTITVSEFEEQLRNKKISEKIIVITFDDGWQDHMLVADILWKENMTATFYAVSGLLNTPQYLTSRELIVLSKKFEIGSHTHTHFLEWESKLDSMTTDYINDDIRNSKKILEDIIGKKVDSFCWPYGYVREDSEKFIRDLGFKSTVHVYGDARNTIDVNPMRIRRINVDGRCSSKDLIKMIETGNVRNCNAH